ncbi:hypothetical protein LOTGIDRAFT_159935 [Lottia gigantea]|uniref:Uncharacterized protein n=1 Tax=Lottia gigantea TaxID=225164 RepID=V4C4N8_LOTGI|nr:hypothetical protein LOTGIDRAFT_159935 [Lottia gigantea]ESO96519.1 hypothetical protein LOTGIDRAFT_159935 [Lottia gigantea]
MKMFCLVGTLVVSCMLVEVLGTCQDQSDNWREYQKAYDINVYNPTHRFYTGKNSGASVGLTGTFVINEKTYEAPAAATILFLFTNDTVPYWFSSYSMIVFLHGYGSPMKISLFHPNGTISVQYLGNKFQSLCRNINCQHEVNIDPMSTHKKELVDPSGWSMFTAILAPYPAGKEGTRKAIYDSELRCKLDGVLDNP